MEKKNEAKGGEQNTNRIIEEPKQSQTDRQAEREKERLEISDY